MRILTALFLLAALAPAARAVRPGPGAKEDAARFGLNRFTPVQRRAPSAAAARAFKAFNAASGGAWSLRYNPRTGLPASLVGGRDVPRPGKTDEAARAFLKERFDVLGVDAANLRLERETRGQGVRHGLYRQSYRGLPVEFAAVKVHLAADGSVLGVHSTYEPAVAVPTSPSVTAAAAGRSAAADAGGGAVRDAPTLVVLPLESDGRAHLAWKMRVDGRGAGSWRYYVDAVTGQVLFRYGIDEFVGACLSSGVVTGLVYDIDPSSTPGTSGQGMVRPFNDQYVYIPDGSGGLTQMVTAHDATYGDGFFCSPTPGKVVMSLQGPYVSVAEFTESSAHYDDGGGVWSTVLTPVSSPHPYPNGSVSVSTIDVSLLAPNAVSVAPVFSDFHVGKFDGGSGEGAGDISDDDQLFVYDSAGRALAAYVGDRGSFSGAEVHGRTMRLALRSNESGQNAGYDIAVSSVLVLTNSPTIDGAPLSSHTWTAADTPSGLRSEVNLFYHLNRMHDYFSSGVNAAGAAPIPGPVVVMAHVGPNLLNAFYDPDYDALYFGDVNASAPSDAFTDDATVPHHEYVHYMVEKIWSIVNYGQAGTLSEANADYFSASSLNDSSIGVSVLNAIGSTSNSGTGALRELDDTKPGALYFNLNSAATPWAGEIHQDSPFLSQALWDVRRAEVSRLGSVAGPACADGLEFQSLLYFPESFAELYEDLLQVDSLGAVAACGGPNAVSSVIRSAFSAHGILPTFGDAYEPDNGFETAVDISTLGVVSATIYPAADEDFYSFGAGPGLVQVTLSLPAVGGQLYKAYQLILYDASRKQVAAAAPPYNGPYTTVDGICNADDCETTAAQVVLNYDNPSGGLLYVQVVGGDSPLGSNSAVNSVIPYALSVSYPRAGALAGAVVSAHADRDVIAFTVHTSTFVTIQDWRFAAAQLRDQAHGAMAGTLTHTPAAAGDRLLFVSSSSAGGG